MFPAARLTDLTLTGDVITAPGAPMVLIASMPAACVGDAVAGPVCTGAIAMGSLTVLTMNRPAARTTSQVAGAITVTGVPMTTAVAPTPAANVLIGG
ncbi:MAG TPA: PAAR domain-containing protein [Planctomycetaceae bacterium]|nr:PAAR domain-containing protein [Planctomycetaceae bacterium]